MNSDIYVQHPQCYGCDDLELDRRLALLKEAGFVLLKSEPDEKGKHWAIWYLAGEWMAKGPIKGMKRKEIVSWLMNHVHPGEITEGGTHWGASVD